MNKISKITLAAVTGLAITCGLSTQALAQAQTIKLQIAEGETIKSQLDKIDNKVITVMLSSDKEITGKVEKVTDKLLHLIEISGKDFYDAVITIDSIQAVIVRAR